jgi:hypothetical protein
MTTNDFIDDIVDSVMAEFGDSVTYYPTIGLPAIISIFIRKKDQLMAGFGSNQIITDGLTIEMHITDLEIEPQVGDRFEFNDKVWVTRSVRGDDTNTRIWFADIVPSS